MTKLGVRNHEKYLKVLQIQRVNGLLLLELEVVLNTLIKLMQTHLKQTYLIYRHSMRLVRKLMDVMVNDQLRKSYGLLTLKGQSYQGMVTQTILQYNVLPVYLVLQKKNLQNYKGVSSLQVLSRRFQKKIQSLVILLKVLLKILRQLMMLKY